MNYSLEKSSIALTSLKRIRSKSIDQLTITDYSVVNLQFSDSHESQLIKVPFTTSTVSTVKDKNLDGLDPRYDYLGFTVLIKNLQTLELLFQDIDEDEAYGDDDENNDDDDVYNVRKRVDLQLISIPVI